MTLSLSSWIRGGLASAAAVLILFIAGCSSEPSQHKKGAQRPRPTPMLGTENFFAGQIAVEIKVGLDRMPEPASTAEAGSRGGGGHGRGHPGGGMGRRSSDGMSGGHGMGEMDGPSGMNEMDGSPDDGGPRMGMGGPRMGGMAGGPPVMIHMLFTNHGTAPVTLFIDSFNSPLGNFAVQPEKLVIEPGQTLEPEAMSSRLAAMFTEVDATLALRMGTQSEKKVVHLNAVKPTPGEPEKTP